MSTTLTDLINEVSTIGVRNSAVSGLVTGWINRAQRQICQRKNFTWMHNRSAFTITAGQTSVSLGSTFKELSSEASPVSFPYGNYNLPVAVLSREQIEGSGFWPWNSDGPFYSQSPGAAVPIRVVFIEQNSGGNWTLNIPPQLVQPGATTFNVSAYYYLADLSGGADHNALTDDGDLCEALVNKAKAIAFQSQDSQTPYAAACEALYNAAYKRAVYSDQARRFAGRLMRM